MSSDTLEYFYGITPERLNAMKNTPPPKSTDDAWKEHYRLQEEYIEELEAELERTKQERNAIAKNTREPLLLKLDEANARIKRLEEFVEQLTNPKFTRDDLPKEALLQRIKRLEEAGDAMMSEPCEYTFDQWLKAKEAKA